MSPTSALSDPQPAASCGCCDGADLGEDTCYCGVEDLLRIIRRRYSLSVLNAIQSRGEARYHDIAAALPAASSSTLAETLHALVATGLIERTHVDDRPQATYTVTAAGRTLLSRLRQLLIEVDES